MLGARSHQLRPSGKRIFLFSFFPIGERGHLISSPESVSELNRGGEAASFGDRFNRIMRIVQETAGEFEFQFSVIPESVK